jgi:hypothetical protein
VLPAADAADAANAAREGTAATREGAAPRSGKAIGGARVKSPVRRGGLQGGLQGGAARTSPPTAPDGDGRMVSGLDGQAGGSRVSTARGGGRPPWSGPPSLQKSGAVDELPSVVARRHVIKYFSLYSVYIQCEGFAKLTCCLPSSPAVTTPPQPWPREACMMHTKVTRAVQAARAAGAAGAAWTGEGRLESGRGKTHFTVLRVAGVAVWR